jgi:hypothetical protein
MSEKKPKIQTIADFLDFDSKVLYRSLQEHLDCWERYSFEPFSLIVAQNRPWADKEIEVLVSLKKKELDKSQLEAYRKELARGRPSTIEEAQILAFNERIKYYYANFIGHNAKHIGTQLELDICDFFRRVKGNIGTSSRRIAKLPILDEAYAEYQRVIKKLGIKETKSSAPSSLACSAVASSAVASSAPASSAVASSAVASSAVASSAWHGTRWIAQSTDSKKPFLQTDAAENIRFCSCADLFRSIQAVTLRQYLEQRLKDGIQIEVVDQQKMPRSISITSDFITNVPRVARCMTVARNLEKIAFTSLYVSGTGLDSVRAAHDAEQEKSEDIDVMKWGATSASIEQMISQIKKLIESKNFKKYLKYKNKYFSLKKQIAL